MIVVHTVEDDVQHIGQQISHHGERGVRGDQLLHHVQDLGLAAGQHVQRHVDVQRLRVGRHRVVSRDLLAHARDEHAGPSTRDAGERVARGAAAVRHGGEGEAVGLAGHPHGGLAAHVQEAEQHLGHLEVRLPQHEAAPDEIDGGAAERRVRAGGVGGDQHQVHQRPGGQPGEVTAQRDHAGVLVTCAVENEIKTRATL